MNEQSMPSHILLVDQESKEAELKRRKQEEITAARKIDLLLRGEESTAKAGCFGNCFGRRQVKKESSQGNSSSRIFGQSKSENSSRSKLENAVSSMKARAEEISDRLQLSRAKALKLARSGRRADGISEMRRAKQLEKQLATANAAVLALESQIDVLQESQLQAEVASALSASVKTVKSKTKGLLSSTEAAVDAVARLSSRSSELSSAWTFGAGRISRPRRPRQAFSISS